MISRLIIGREIQKKTFQKMASTATDTSSSFKCQQGASSLAIGTRIHLGNASAPPPNEKLQTMLTSFVNFCHSIRKDETTTHAYIAVDATPKFDGYDLVETIQSLYYDRWRNQVLWK